MFDQGDDVNPYLQQEVMSASPARLRLMLIRRAHELCGVVQQYWQSEDPSQADQWLLRIREILGELLGGVTDTENPVSEKVSDFYVFLLQIAAELDAEINFERMATLQELLAIEMETWAQVAAKLDSLAQNADAEQVILQFDQGQSTEGSFSMEV